VNGDFVWRDAGRVVVLRHGGVSQAPRLLHEHGFAEFELLTCLMMRPGRLFNRQELLRSIWGDSAYRDPRAIDVHIRHLREKLETDPARPTLILTVRGIGYRLVTA